MRSLTEEGARARLAEIVRLADGRVVRCEPFGAGHVHRVGRGTVAAATIRAMVRRGWLVATRAGEYHVTDDGWRVLGGRA